MNVLLQEWKTKAVKLIHDTPIEVAIGGGLLAFAFGVSSYLHEDSKRGFIPLAFSEIGQTKFQLTTLRGLKVPPLTMQYSVTNDVAAMVFEASNIGYKWGVGKAWSRTNRIAYELEKKVDPSMRIHTLIPTYAAQMETIAAEAQQSIAPATAALSDIKPVIAALDNAWDEDHDDVYRTEVYTENVCSSDGRFGHQLAMRLIRHRHQHVVIGPCCPGVGQIQIFITLDMLIIRQAFAAFANSPLVLGIRLMRQ